MQAIVVLPFASADYVHEDEVVLIQHRASRAEYQVLMKDLDTSDLSNGRVGILIPQALVEDIIVQDAYLTVVLSTKGKKALAGLWPEIGEALSKVRTRGKRSAK